MNSEVKQRRSHPPTRTFVLDNPPEFVHADGTVPVNVDFSEHFSEMSWHQNTGKSGKMGWRGKLA